MVHPIPTSPFIHLNDFFFAFSVAVVGLEKTAYSVSEGDGTLQVCAVLNNPSGTCLTFTIGIESSRRGSAGKYSILVCIMAFSSCNTFLTVSVMDYGPVATTLNFNRCARRKCLVVSIINDMTVENDESFHIALVRTPGLARNTQKMELLK